jgi:hypothetical protein
MDGGIIGVSDHGGWAVFLTVARDGSILDRRRVELVDETLPALPYHHEGQLLTMDAAVALVERVRASARRHAVLALDAVAMVVPKILGIALRRCPRLPLTIAERLSDYRARNLADWVMYRKALAGAALARGWSIDWYDAKKVLGSVSQTLRVENFDDYFLRVRKIMGPPWNEDHKLAMAAAIVSARAFTAERGARSPAAAADGAAAAAHRPGSALRSSPPDAQRCDSRSIPTNVRGRSRVR